MCKKEYLVRFGQYRVSTETGKPGKIKMLIGILTILHPECYQFVQFMLIIRSLVAVQKLFLLTFSAKCCVCKFEKRFGHGKKKHSWKNHGIRFAMVV